MSETVPGRSAGRRPEQRQGLSPPGTPPPVSCWLLAHTCPLVACSTATVTVSSQSSLHLVNQICSFQQSPHSFVAISGLCHQQFSVPSVHFVYWPLNSRPQASWQPVPYVINIISSPYNPCVSVTAQLCLLANCVETSAHFHPLAFISLMRERERERGGGGGRKREWEGWTDLTRVMHEVTTQIYRSKHRSSCCSFVSESVKRKKDRNTQTNKVHSEILVCWSQNSTDVSVWTPVYLEALSIV